MFFYQSWTIHSRSEAAPQWDAHSVSPAVWTACCERQCDSLGDEYELSELHLISQISLCVLPFTQIQTHLKLLKSWFQHLEYWTNSALHSNIVRLTVDSLKKRIKIDAAESEIFSFLIPCIHPCWNLALSWRFSCVMLEGANKMLASSRDGEQATVYFCITPQPLIYIFFHFKLVVFSPSPSDSTWVNLGDFTQLSLDSTKYFIQLFLFPHIHSSSSPNPVNRLTKIGGYLFITSNTYE